MKDELGLTEQSTIDMGKNAKKAMDTESSQKPAPMKSEKVKKGGKTFNLQSC